MSATEAAALQPSRSGRLLALVHQLIDYGRQLAATLRTDPQPFGSSDVALILARIMRGLLRAEALEARIIRTAPRLDAEATPPRAPSRRRTPTACAATAEPTDRTDLGPDAGIGLPTPEQIAVEVRRRPIGAVIADICRDLGIMPSHPLWRELSELVIRYGGNLAKLVKDVCERAFARFAAACPLAPAPTLQSPAPGGTGPP